MPPVLDPTKSKVDGLAFLGLSLSRKSDEHGHPDSVTHQTAFDLNKVLDRDYAYIFSTNDDGWLVGGGEPGPPTTYKLAAKDSAHVEIMRIGTYRKEWGGVPLEEILNVMQSGDILIPQIEVLPTAVGENPDTPPELEIRFDMEPDIIADFDDYENTPLPVNWQLRFLHNQFFKKFIFPSRFCPGAFHSTILRKAEFRSDEHRKMYFAKCDAAIAGWRKLGPQPLNTVPRTLEGEPIMKEEVPAPITGETAAESAIEEKATSDCVVSAAAESDLSFPADDGEEKKEDGNGASNTYHPSSASVLSKNEQIVKGATNINEGDDVDTVYGRGKVIAITTSSSILECETLQIELPYGHLFVRLTELVQKASSSTEVKEGGEKTIGSSVTSPPAEYHSGVWLFVDRENITHFFKPNFLPPYDTPEKKKIILDVLREEWDEKTLTWKPCGQGSMTKSKPLGNKNGMSLLGDIPPLDQLDQFMGDVLSTINSCCTPQAKPVTNSSLK